MSLSRLKEDLVALMRQPPQSADDAERAARAAEALAAYIRAEEGAELVLSEQSTDAAPDQGSLAGLTLHDAARRVLETAGIPLHVKELGRRIKAGGWRHKRSRKARPEQINYQLAARLPRHPDVFRRVSPNTFGLARWDVRRTEKVRPRTALFRGPGGEHAALLGDRADEVIEIHEWRSS